MFFMFFFTLRFVLPPGLPGELVARADGRGPIASEVPRPKTPRPKL